jgi:beta-galactosidase
MNRWLGCVLVLLALGSVHVAAERLTLNFNPDWKFIKADPSGAAVPHPFDDGQWMIVSAPHTFNDTDTFDDWSLPGHRGEQNQWSGRTWYRKAFTLPAAFRGKKVFIEFEAVRHVAEVYLNGQLLGVSKSGFTPFGFDLTPHLRFDGATNVLAVMCDNRFMRDPLPSEGAAGHPNLGQLSAKVNETIPEDVDEIRADQLPWNNPHWHPAYGGIYRNVRLHVTDPLHISLPLYSFLETAGPYVYATEISGKSARINVEVPVQNDRKSAEKVEVRVDVSDQFGKPVLILNQNGQIAANGRGELKVAGVLDKPRLWEPDYPHLYRVVCSLQANGRTVDTAEVPFGIRTAHWDAQTGFTINGRGLKLRGWGQKPTGEWPGLGAAHPDWMHFYTLQLMREAGANFVRWGHCAGGPASITAADRLGIITDQPGVDGESDTRGAAWKIRAATFRDTIIYFRNNPSILIWEGGNQKVSREHARELRGFMDQYDPHGGRAYAHRRADKITAEFMDVGIGTEGGREIKDLAVVEGEYNREESPRRVWDDFSPPNFGYPEAKGQTYHLTSEQFAVNQVAQFMKKLGAVDHCGGANWIFTDSTSGGRVGVEVCRTSGEVDGVRLPKEAWYVCRAVFHEAPRVHIIGHWTYPAGTKKTIYVASNTDEVELLVNGKSLGRGKISDRHLFTFPEVQWEAGEIKAVAYKQGKEVTTQVKWTVGPAVALRITPMTGPNGFLADGSDVALLDVEAVDAKGERCPTFQQPVDFSLEGEGIWRGGYNSGKTNSINHTWLDVECGINRVAVRSTRNAGTIVLRANSNGLKPGSVTIKSVPVKVENGSMSTLPAMPLVSLPANAPVRTILAAATQNPKSRIQNQQPGRFIKSFNYSGPSSYIVHVESNAQNGKNAYVDGDSPFSDLPQALAGADWVQMANRDSRYNAVDLMELAVMANTIVSIAHDDRLKRPDWLTKQFKATEVAITINRQPMKIFQRRVEHDESLTLGANTEDANVSAANAYLVFVNAAAKRSSSTKPIDVAALDRNRILEAADTALRMAPVTITKHRAKLSEGGPNDFYSNGDYWWPDPSKPDGLPYIQRDGESNPGNFFHHRTAVRALRDAVAALGAAYKITGDDRYVAKSVELLHVFFLDAQTRMNPHLKYAQAIPGRTPGRGIGIIDTLHLAEIPLAIEAIQKSPAFPSQVLSGLKQWFRDYLAWMTTSKNGKEEAAAKNNHSVAYFLQVACFAKLTGDESRLAECRRQFKEVFVPNQMALDGSFPAELKRTKPYGYSIFQLDNLATLAQVLSTPSDNPSSVAASRVERATEEGLRRVDMWTWEMPDGRGILKAVEFLYPYLADKSKWPHKRDIQSWEGWPARQPCLLFAGLALGEQKYLDLWTKLPADPRDDEVRRNIAITQPVLWIK